MRALASCTAASLTIRARSAVVCAGFVDGLLLDTTQTLLALAISLQVVKSVATGLLKLRVLPSRWSYVVYSSYASLDISTACTASPLLLK